MRTIALFIALTAACTTNEDPNADYPIEPGGQYGGTGAGNGPDPVPPAPKAPFASAPYTVTWVAGPLLDANGEGSELVCTPALCAPLTTRTTISSIVAQADGRLRFTFATGTTGITIVTSTKPASKTVTVAAQTDAVGARHAFDIVEDASGVLHGSIDWDVENVPQTPDDDQFVHFDFTAAP